MKRIAFPVLLAIVLLSETARAVDVTVYDSIVSLATNVTKNYTFIDPTNGLEVVVVVTMSPYSSITNNPVFTLLDGDTHLGVESSTNSGDGNWVDSPEGVDFTASLLSISNGIVTNSVRLGIAGMGMRPNGGTLLWTSSAITNTFDVASESLAPLDTNLARLAGNTYAGSLRFAGTGDQRYQISNAGSLDGQSFVVTVTFIEGTGEPVVTLNPSAQAVCAGNAASFSAAADGDPDPSVQWQVQTNGGASYLPVPGATNATLSFTPGLSDSGNLYRAAFANFHGGATTTVAALSVSVAPSVLITLGSTNPAPQSFTNTASAAAGAAGYAWTISNGYFTSAATLQTVTYAVGLSGNVTIGLTVSNNTGCAASSFTNIVIGPLTGVTGGPGVYVSDDGNYIEKFDSNGVASLFAIANMNAPSGVAFDRFGNLFVANYLAGTIYRFNTNGAGSLFAGGLNSPHALAFDGNGNLYVDNIDDGTVYKFTTNGVGSVFAGDRTTPTGMAFDREGNLYVADIDAGEIWKYDTNAVGTLFKDGFGYPYGLAFDATGNLFVADDDSGDVEKIAPDGTQENFANGLGDAIGLAFDTEGNLFVADETLIRKYEPDGSHYILNSNGLTFAEYIAVWPIPRQLIPANSASFSTPSLSGSQFQFTVSGSAGAEYVTQAATNIAAPDWISISTNTSPFPFIDTNTATFGKRFYRAIDAR